MEFSDEHASRLLRPLAGELSGKSTVDIGRAMADGRRRRRVHRVTGLSAVAGATALTLIGAGLVLAQPPSRSASPPGTSAPAPSVPGPTRPPASPRPVPPPAPASCTVSRLPEVRGHRESIVTGADPTGRYILGRSYPGAGGSPSRPPLIWDNGHMIMVDMPGADQALNDINSHGLAVGDSFVSDKQVPWVYQNGKVTQLPGGYDASAEAINEAGQIFGYRTSGAQSVPVVWPSATAAPVDLAMPSGYRGSMGGLDEDGTIASTLEIYQGDAKPYVWTPDGSSRQLPMPTVDGQPATGALVQDIRSGWAVGFIGKTIATANGQTAGTSIVRWDTRTGAIRIEPGLGVPVVVNKHGWMVGQAQRDARDPYSQQAAFVSDQGIVRLPDPPGYSGPDTVTNAQTISDDGTTIAGTVSRQGTADGSAIHAVMWRCR